VPTPFQSSTILIATDHSYFSLPVAHHVLLEEGNESFVRGLPEGVKDLLVKELLSHQVEDKAEDFVAVAVLVE
jgi:hypothetical protein